MIEYVEIFYMKLLRMFLLLMSVHVFVQILNKNIYAFESLHFSFQITYPSELLSCVLLKCLIYNIV